MEEHCVCCETLISWSTFRTRFIKPADLSTTPSFTLTDSTKTYKPSGKNSFPKHFPSQFHELSPQWCQCSFCWFQWFSVFSSPAAPLAPVLVLCRMLWNGSTCHKLRTLRFYMWICSCRVLLFVCRGVGQIKGFKTTIHLSVPCQKRRNVRLPKWGLLHIISSQSVVVFTFFPPLDC